MEHTVVSVTSMHDGDARNVIPDQAELRCNVRSFNEAVSRTIDTGVWQIIQKYPAAFGASARVNRPSITLDPPTIDHPRKTEMALSAMHAVAGVACVHPRLTSQPTK